MRSRAERAALYRKRAKSMKRLAKTAAGDAVTETMLLNLASDYENLARTLEDSIVQIAPIQPRPRAGRTVGWLG